MGKPSSGSCALAGRVDDLLAAFRGEEALAEAINCGIDTCERLKRIVKRDQKQAKGEQSSERVAYSFLEDLHRSGFGHLNVAFEYAMPGSSRRADAIVYSLASNTMQGKRIYLVVEFKDWTDDYINQFRGFREQGCQLLSDVNIEGWKPVKHPLDQARNYVNYLLNFHSGIAEGAAKNDLRVYSCCYIPNLKTKELIANEDYIRKNFPDDKNPKQEKYERYVLTSAEDDKADFIDFFGRYWRPSEVVELESRPLRPNSEHYDELLEGKYSISANARKDLKEIFQGKGEEDGHPTNPVVLAYGNVAKLIAALRTIDGAFASDTSTVMVIRGVDSNFGLILLDALLEQRYSEIVLQADGNVLDQLQKGRTKADDLSLHNAFGWQHSVETEIGIVDLANRKDGQRDFDGIIAESEGGKAKVIIFLAPDNLAIDASGANGWTVVSI